MQMRGFHFCETSPAFRLVEAIERDVGSGGLGLNLRSAHWVLDYALTPDGLSRTDGTPWEERKVGSGHLYPPGCVYHEDARGTKRRHSLWILFDGEDPFLRGLAQNSAGFARIRDDGRRLQGLLYELVRSALRGNRGYWEAFAVFCRLRQLLETLRPTGEDDYTFGWEEREEPLGERLQDYLEQHFAEELSLRGLARHFCCSESGLAHRCQAECGESVFGMLRRIRLEQSLPLLRRGERLKTIAAATGFGSEYYYSRCFTAAYGVSPRAWRNARGETP